MPYRTVEAQTQLGFPAGHIIRGDMDYQRELELEQERKIRFTRNACGDTDIVCSVCGESVTVHDRTLRDEAICLGCWCERENNKNKERYNEKQA